MEFTTSTRGKPSVILNGYRYTIRNEKQCGDIVWRCVNRSCNAKIVTNKEELVKEDKHQTCVPDVAALEVLKAKIQAKKRAREDFNRPINQVSLKLNSI